MLKQTLARSEAGRTGVPKRYFSEREMAEYCGIAIRTLQGWRLRNQGPPFRKLCGAVKYDINEFDAWVKACPGGGGNETEARI